MNVRGLRRILALLCISLLALTAVACEEEVAEPEAADEQEEPAEAEEEEEEEEEEAAGTLPEETEVIALDEGESEIPATIEVPVGVRTFNDTPTRIRIDYEGETRGIMGPGELFGVQIAEGTEFNVDLEATWEGLEENLYGQTNELIEKTDELLRFTSTSDDTGHRSHRFRLLVELNDQVWVCSEGNYGGFTAEQIDRQIAACETLAPKEG